MLDSMRARFVRDGRGWWKLWSNQFAVLMGAVAGWAVDNRADVMSYVDQVPQPWRSLLAAIVVAGIPVYLRMARQPKLQASSGLPCSPGQD